MILFYMGVQGVGGTNSSNTFLLVLYVKGLVVGSLVSKEKSSKDDKDTFNTCNLKEKQQRKIDKFDHPTPILSTRL